MPNTLYVVPIGSDYVPRPRKVNGDISITSFNTGSPPFPKKDPVSKQT